MQSNLRSLFAGKREAVELQPKRGPGRPPKVRKKEEEEDEVLKALQSMPDGHEAYDEQLRRRRKRKAEGQAVTALEEAAGKTFAEMRMPGSFQRNHQHEGPQVKLQLCIWFEKTLA